MIPMQVTVYREGCREDIDTTMLSFQDGVLAGSDMLIWEGFEERGLRLSRSYFDAESDDPLLLRSELRLVTPEDMAEVRAVTVNGATALIRNLDTGELDCLLDKAVDELLEKSQDSLGGSGNEDDAFEEALAEALGEHLGEDDAAPSAFAGLMDPEDGDAE